MEIKMYLKSLLWTFILLTSMLLVINSLYYFDIISNTFVKYAKFIVLLLSCFVGGFIRGINSSNKGYLNGIRLASIFILIIFILSLILKEFNWIDLVYYLIITLTIVFGSMIGIGKKKVD